MKKHLRLYLQAAAVCAVAAVSVLSQPASARVYVNLGIAPPAPIVEYAPEPRVGYVWAPGYWEWRGGRHVWIEGRYMPERYGHHWIPAHWEEHYGRWEFVPGFWD